MRMFESDSARNDVIAPSGRIMHTWHIEGLVNNTGIILTVNAVCLLYKSSTQPCGPLKVT